MMNKNIKEAIKYCELDIRNGYWFNMLYKLSFPAKDGEIYLTGKEIREVISILTQKLDVSLTTTILDVVYKICEEALQRVKRNDFTFFQLWHTLESNWCGLSSSELIECLHDWSDLLNIKVSDKTNLCMIKKL